MSDLLLVSLTLNGLAFTALLVALARREYWRWRVRREARRARKWRVEYLAGKTLSMRRYDAAKWDVMREADHE